MGIGIRCVEEFILSKSGIDEVFFRGVNPGYSSIKTEMRCGKQCGKNAPFHKADEKSTNIPFQGGSQCACTCGPSTLSTQFRTF